MPLINSSSKSARDENIKREIASDRDPKQAVAIGYSVQRQAAAKHGGGKHSRDHALSKASATHLHRMGHITKDHHDRIHRDSDRALSAGHYAPAGGGNGAPLGAPDGDGM